MKHVLFLPILLLLSGCSLFENDDDPSARTVSFDCTIQTEACTISERNVGFAWDIFSQLQRDKPDTNLFISPLSISTALSMTMNGAKGETLEEMQQTLGYDQLQLDEINRGYQQLLENLPFIDQYIELGLANSIWYRDDFQILDEEIVDVNDNVIILKDIMSMDSMTFYGIDTLTGTSEVTMEGGKIKTFNFSWSDETVADLQAAPFVAPDDLIGIWSVGTYLQINEDGTLRVADRIEDLSEPVSEEHPGSKQVWTYDGMVITFQGIEGAGEGYVGDNCDQIGAYFVRWAGPDLDRLKFKPIEDPCGSRYGGMMWGNWAPISP